MLSKLIIASELEIQKLAALRELEKLELSQNHPDLLWIEDEGKIGVEEMKKVREHFSFKPYSARGKAVVILAAENLTVDAQNSLLKTLEEPPETGSLILAAASESELLPTILSRCEIIQLSTNSRQPSALSGEEIKKLMGLSLEERFKVVEQTEDKEGLLELLAGFIHSELPEHPEKVKLAKLLIKAGEWQKSNVPLRTILEYLMLEM